MPTAQSRGHGLIILTFWCLAALVEIFTLISYRSSLWFFQPLVRQDPPAAEIDLVRFGYWIFRLVATLLVFFIGLRAPGVPRRRYAVMLNRSQSQLDEDRNKQGVWTKFLRHFKTLAPFIWPKGHYGLQLNFFICVVILLLGRLLSIEIPRYTKLISKVTITIGRFSRSSSSRRFDWTGKWNDRYISQSRCSLACHGYVAMEISDDSDGSSLSSR